MSTNQEKLFGRLLLKNDILQLIKNTDKISVSKIFTDKKSVSNDRLFFDFNK